MIYRIIHAVAIGFIVGLVCLFLAMILPSIHVEVITKIGNFLGDWAWPIDIVVGLLDFVSGGIGPRFGAPAA